MVLGVCTSSTREHPDFDDIWGSWSSSANQERNIFDICPFWQHVVPKFFGHPGTPGFWPVLTKMWFLRTLATKERHEFDHFGHVWFLAHLSHLVAPSFWHFWQCMVLGASQPPGNATMSTNMANHVSREPQQPKNNTILTYFCKV